MVDLVLKEESYKIIGACMEVHKNLGCGFLEPVYQEILAMEFKLQDIPFEQEKKINIYYKGMQISKYYITDFICYDKVVVELKAATDITTEFEAQVLNYLKATGLNLGLIVNFGNMSLQFKRIVR